MWSDVVLIFDCFFLLFKGGGDEERDFSEVLGCGCECEQRINQILNF